MSRFLSGFTLVLFFVLLSGCDSTARFIYENGLALEKHRAGLEDKTYTSQDDLNWHFLESKAAEDQEAVLLVHGFGADSSNWIRFANELEGDYHFIIPDLPGHGDSTSDPSLDYPMQLQATRLLELMKQLGYTHFHVAGNSMGGGIAMKMAAQAPQQVLSIGLIDSAGLAVTTEEFSQMLSGGDNPLIPRKAEDMFTTLDWAMHDAPWLPDAFVTVMGQKKADNLETTLKIWADLQQELNGDYTPVASNIRTPALIMWGEKDRLLDVSSVPLYESALRHSETVIYENIGHVPMVEAPGQSAADLDRFWSKHSLSIQSPN